MYSYSVETIDREDLEPGLLSVPAAKKPGRKIPAIHLLLLSLVSGVVFLCSASICCQLDIPTGDEPHYLVISQTLLLYHSLDVTLDYSHADYKVFYGGPLGPLQHTSPNKWGHLLPLHSIGAPVLWLIPFALDGRLGTLFFMSVVSMLIILTIYLLLLSLGIRYNYALLVCLGMALASPIWIFSHHNFVEPIAALICVYVVQILFKARPRVWELLVASLTLGILPWLHIRFALFEVVLTCFLLFRVYQDYRLRKLRMYLPVLLPVIAMFLLFESYNVFVWGSLNPAVNQANSGELPFDVSPWRGLFGLFFDQEYGLLTNFPIFLFLPAGMILACRRELLRYNLLLLCLSVPYLITIASFHNWDGAISPPARFVMVLVPLGAFYLALALQTARSWLINGLFLLFMGIAVLYEVVSLNVPGGWINWQEGHSRPLLTIAQTLHLPLTRGIPSVFLPNQELPAVGCLLFLSVLTLATVRLSRR